MQKMLFSFLAAIFIFSPVQAGTITFSAAQHLTTLPWATDTHPGVSTKGVDWLVVDSHHRYWLETDRDFSLFAPNGHALQTTSPLDKNLNFYGFAEMESQPDGGLAVLERLETLQEQRGKFNFQLSSRPGAELILLSPEGKLEGIKQERDPLQPHSLYELQNSQVISIHADGTYQVLDSLGAPIKDKSFSAFAVIADSINWNAHVKTLSVFHTTSRFYHDEADRLHVDKNSKYYLMGKPFVEGGAPLAVRGGKIYDAVICYPKGNFTNWVFVEDPAQKTYTMVELVTADEDLNTAQDHTVFVDPKGNIYEGVAKDDGYRIYEWRVLR